MAKEATLFKELDQLYDRASKAKQFLDRYQLNGGDTDELKQILRRILKEDVQELKLLNAAMQHVGHSMTKQEQKAVSEIIKFIGLLYDEVSLALIDLERTKLSKISWFLQSILAEIEAVHAAERKPLERMASRQHVKAVRILARLEEVRLQLNSLRTEAKAVYGRSIDKKIKFTNHNYPLIRIFKNRLNVDLEEGAPMQVYLYVVYCYLDYLDSHLQITMTELMHYKKLTVSVNGHNVAQKIMTTYGNLVDLISLVNAFIDYFEVKHYKKLVGILTVLRRKLLQSHNKLLKLLDEHSGIVAHSDDEHTLKKYIESSANSNERYLLFKMWLIQNHILQNNKITVLRM